MEPAAIGIALEIIRTIIHVLQGLRNTPHVVQSIEKQLANIEGLLRALYHLSETYIITDAFMDDWRGYQDSCHKTLRRIEAILEKHAATSPILGFVKFQFGPKEELSRLSEDLDNCRKCFLKFQEM
jgi:hypothetical protein